MCVVNNIQMQTDAKISVRKLQHLSTSNVLFRKKKEIAVNQYINVCKRAIAPFFFLLLILVQSNYNPILYWIALMNHDFTLIL